MAQHELSGTQPERRANPTHLIVQFDEVITLATAQGLEDVLKEGSARASIPRPVDMYVAYDDGFGHLLRTDPKGAPTHESA